MLSSHVFIVFSLLSEYDGSFLLLSYRWAYYCCYYCTIFHRDSYQFEKFILHFSISFPDLSFPVLKFSGSLPNLSILNGFHSLFSGYGLIRFYRVGSIKREFYWGGGRTAVYLLIPTEPCLFDDGVFGLFGKIIVPQRILWLVVRPLVSDCWEE